MKTLQEIKDEVAKDFDYASFTTLYNLDQVSNAVIDEIAKRYAKECIIETVEIYDAHTEEGRLDKGEALYNSLNILK